MNKIEEKNSLWLALNFVFPKLQEKEYVSKSLKFKIFVDEKLVADVGKEDNLTFITNMKLNCKVDILKGDWKTGKVSSSFSWIVGEEFATLYLDESTSKKVKLNFANQNRVEIFDERDFELIDEDGNIIKELEDEKSASDII